MEPPLINEALCLSTPKHNGKSGTDHVGIRNWNIIETTFYTLHRLDCLIV